MGTLLKILIIEDSEDDVFLILHQIKKGGYVVEYERVETAETMKAALKEKTWDIILSDYKMPHFSVLDALTILKESGIDIPFIVISGTIGEDVAVETMKAGAHDYLMKGNLQRLLPAIERELCELKSRTERKYLEQKQRLADEDRLAHLRYFENMDRINCAIQGAHYLEQMMSDVLETTLSIFDCDRSWLLYPCDPDALFFRVPMEITKSEYPGAKVLNVNIPMSPDEARNMQEALESDMPVTYTAGTERPISTAKQFGVQSQMFVPVYPKLDKPWVFGMHQCSFPRIWTQEEKQLFHEISRRLSDALSSLLILHDLKESEEKYRALIQKIRAAVVVHGSDTQILTSNSMAQELLGLTEDQMLGKSSVDPDWHFLREDGSTMSLEEYPVNQVFVKNQELRNFIVGVHRPKKENDVWVLVNADPIFDNKGEIAQVIVTFVDITERKRVEDALQKKVIALSKPIYNILDIQFQDLFNIEDIQRIQDEFADATKVASIITNPDGTPITKPSNFCRLCNEIIRKTEKGLINCFKSDAEIGRQNCEGPIIQPCLSGGLWDAGASITLGGKHIANWLIGQVRNDELNEEQMLQYADVIGTDREEFKKALAEVPVMQKEQFDKVAKALFSLANELSLKAYQNIQQAHFITEHKIIEDKIKFLLAEKEMLLKEVHHRIKNNINIMISLVSLQSEKLKDQSVIAALKDTKSRLQSMGVLYDTLYHSGNLKDIPINDFLSPLVDRIVEMFPDSTKIKVEKRIENFILGVKILSPLGIIVNEILTNIMKYAFTGMDNGLITILASLKNNHVTVVIQDNGKGLPESINFETSTGFGLKLVDMLTKQIEGSIQIKKELGTKFILEFDI